MNLSGILVLAPPDRMDAVMGALGRLSGVEVHHYDRDGRIVAVQEATTIDDEVAGLRRIQGLPHVSSAELIYHYFAEDQDLSHGS